MSFQSLLAFDLGSSFVDGLSCWAIFILLLVLVVSSALSGLGYPLLGRLSAWLCIFSLSCILVVLLNEASGIRSIYQGLIRNDIFCLGARCITIVSAAFVMFCSLDYIRRDRINSTELTGLMLLSVLSALTLIGSNDLLTVYLAVEMQSLCFYVLATFQRSSNFSTESGLKYFVLGAVSSGLLLFGCSLVYGFSGSTNFDDIHRLLLHVDASSAAGGLILGMFFLLVAFMFKLAVVPFHIWVVDVYEGSPTPVTAFFSIVPKLPLLCVCFKLCCYVFLQFNICWRPVFVVCCMLSLVVGCLGAFYQRKIKRLMAFSAVVHAGFLVLAIASFAHDSLPALLLYLVIYIWMALVFFGVLLAFRFVATSGRLIYLTELMGLSRVNPLFAVTLVICMFSMAGVPPFAGFFSKMSVFTVAINARYHLTAAAALLISALAAVYYVRLIKIMYFDEPRGLLWLVPVDKSSGWVLVIFTAFVVLFAAFPDYLLVWIDFVCFGAF